MKHKQILTLSKKQIIQLCIKEIERVQNLPSTKTNRATIKKMFLIADMVKNADDNLEVQVEGVRGNHKIRDFELFNTGSLIETLVKHYRKGYIKSYKSFNDDESDEMDGFMEYEIKSSLPNARNTVNTKDQPIIFVNTKGVYLIKKDAYKNIKLDSRNKMYENLDYSVFEGVKLIQSLSQKLGLL